MHTIIKVLTVLLFNSTVSNCNTSNLLQPYSAHSGCVIQSRDCFFCCQSSHVHKFIIHDSYKKHRGLHFCRHSTRKWTCIYFEHAAQYPDTLGRFSFFGWAHHFSTQPSCLSACNKYAICGNTEGLFMKMITSLKSFIEKFPLFFLYIQRYLIILKNK